jgi:hypothetical protein
MAAVRRAVRVLLLVSALQNKYEIQKHAITLVHEVVEERRTALPLALSARFLPLAAAERPDYDAWAARWLARWLSASHSPKIDTAAEIAASLADLPTEPQALDGILGLI